MKKMSFMSEKKAILVWNHWLPGPLEDGSCRPWWKVYRAEGKILYYPPLLRPHMDFNLHYFPEDQWNHFACSLVATYHGRCSPAQFSTSGATLLHRLYLQVTVPCIHNLEDGAGNCTWLKENPIFSAYSPTRRRKRFWGCLWLCFCTHPLKIHIFSHTLPTGPQDATLGRHIVIIVLEGGDATRCGFPLRLPDRDIWMLKYLCSLPTSDNVTIIPIENAFKCFMPVVDYEGKILWWWHRWIVCWIWYEYVAGCSLF